jgi:hypothetical protein
MEPFQCVGLASAMAAQRMVLNDLPKFLSQLPGSVFDEHKETLIGAMAIPFGSWDVSKWYVNNFSYMTEDVEKVM